LSNLPSPVDTVLKDLRSTAAAIAKSDSPAETRRLFSTFVSDSKALTEYMRKEYKQLTGRDWAPGNWTGWNDVTKLVTMLRNYDRHERPLLLLARQRYYFPITLAADSQELVFQGDWGPLDPQDTVVPDSLSLHLADPKTKAMTDQTVAPYKREIQFIPFADDPEVNAQLDRISEKNVRAVTQSSLAVLEAYVTWYSQELRGSTPHAGHADLH